RLLPVFGLESYADHLPWQLSGGLRQRAALARTYMTGSKVLLLDEPLANLDAITRSGLQDWLGEVVHNLSLAIILVTHDIDEAIKLSDRIEVMKDGLFVASFQVDNRLDEHSQRILKEHIQNAL
ncbi:MAG: ATP-binding cassette domain-containing protein, partial [Spirochaetia bacterium]|nr:ATP-binding cassette domain-containing protein [Spirochaetia bacterium]